MSHDIGMYYEHIASGCAKITSIYKYIGTYKDSGMANICN